MAVLVPLDGSDKDERAMRAASAMAELTGSAIHMIRVLGPPVSSLSPRARTMGGLDAALEQRDDVLRNLSAWAERLRVDTGELVTAEVTEGFDVAQILVDKAAEGDIDAVVMATRAPGALGRALRGSVADRVVRESSRPVLLAPPGADTISAERIKLKRVLVALDGSALALAAIDRLLGFDRSHALAYVLLEVVPTAFSGTKLEAPSGISADAFSARRDEREPSPAREREAADERLRAVADRLRMRGAPAIGMHVLEHHDPATGIRNVARQEGVDFIAMSTRGLRGLERLVLGSVAEAVVRDSDLPVLVVRPDATG